MLGAEPPVDDRNPALRELLHAAGLQPAVHRSAPWRFVYDSTTNDRATACEIEPARAGCERPPCAETTAYTTAGVHGISSSRKGTNDINGRPKSYAC